MMSNSNCGRDYREGGEAGAERLSAIEKPQQQKNKTKNKNWNNPTPGLILLASGERSRKALSVHWQFPGSLTGQLLSFLANTLTLLLSLGARHSQFEVNVIKA